MPLCVMLDNGKRIEAPINCWVVALIQCLKPEDLALVAEKAEKLNTEPRLVTIREERAHQTPGFN